MERAEQQHFSLDKEKWEKLCQALDQPPRDIPALRKLATEQTVLEKAMVIFPELPVQYES